MARTDSILAVWSSYEEIVDALKELQNVQGTKSKTKAKNLLARLCSFEFIAMVNVHEKYRGKNQDTNKTTSDS